MGLYSFRRVLIEEIASVWEAASRSRRNTHNLSIFPSHYRGQLMLPLDQRRTLLVIVGVTVVDCGKAALNVVE